MKRIADYALIGDCRSAALVHRDGAIEWFCADRFDGSAVFAALLGDGRNGIWDIAPAVASESRRRYRHNTLLLETTFQASEGEFRLTDFMPRKSKHCTIVRIIEGIQGAIPARMLFRPRMRYGVVPPLIEPESGGWSARLAPIGLYLHSSIPLNVLPGQLQADFLITAGMTVVFTLQTFPAHETAPPDIDALAAIDQTCRWWQSWVAGLTYCGEWKDIVIRSAITLKALQYEPAGSFIAAVTTSLPEKIGGTKNWDYRYCWLRDASYVTDALLRLGSTAEARPWLDWFMRVCVRLPDQLRIMYQVDGNFLGDEYNVVGLGGFAGSIPVRIANNAHQQFQLGVYGDVLMAFEHAQRCGVTLDEPAWKTIEALLQHVEQVWQQPGNGIWETRDGGKQYVTSKVMAWVAIQRGITIARRGTFVTDYGHWESLASTMHAQIIRIGFDPTRDTFTEFYGSAELDASVLLMPLHGFLAANDQRIVGTIAAIERKLMRKGYVYRYSSDHVHEAAIVFPQEGSFLMCGFWLAEVYFEMGRIHDAKALFTRLLGAANDVGLFSEEFDPDFDMAIGNFPQAFSHVGLINAACRFARQ